MRPLQRATKISALLAVTSLLLIHRGGAVHAQSPALSWDGLIEHVTAPSFVIPPAPDGSSQLPRHSMSADGRYVVFTSDATNLNPYGAVLLRDRATGEVQPVFGSYLVSDLAMSADGNYIAMRMCDQYRRPDQAPICDVWVYDRRTPRLIPISVALDGTFGDADSGLPVLSATGRFVVFRTNATNLLPPGAAPGQLVVVDRDADGNGIFDEAGTQTIDLVSAADGSTTPGNGVSDSAEISADGRFVAFRSMASNLVALDNNMGWDVFERDRLTSETRLLTRRPTGQPSPVPTDRPEISMSADGRFVAFASTDRYLAGTDDNDPFEDVFVYDHDTQVLSRIVLQDAIADLFDVDSPMLTADGRYVVVRALSNNSAVPWGGQARSIFVVDRTTGMSTKVSVLPDGSDLDWHADSPEISGDGTVVLFTSKAANPAIGLDYQFDKIFAVVHFDVQPPEVHVPGRGGSGVFTVTTQQYTRWSAQWDWSQQWLSFDNPPHPDAGSGQVHFVAQYPNYDPVPRSMSITIGSRAVTFTQNAGLSLTSVSPAVGPLAGGTLVTLHGTGFEPGMRMSTGLSDTTVYPEFVDETTARVTMPPGLSPGLTYVVIGTTDFRGANLDNAFRYLDATPPLVWPMIDAWPSDSGWYNTDVPVSWNVWDGDTAVTTTSGCGTTVINTDTPGVTLTCSATSEGGTTTQSVTIKRDTTPPQIVLTQPAARALYSQGDVVPAAYSCTDALSGTNVCIGDLAAGDPIDTSYSGFDRTFSVTTSDKAGNFAWTSVTYDVATNYCTSFDPPRLWWRMDGDTVDIRSGLSAAANNVSLGFAAALVGQGLSLPNRTDGFLQVAPSSKLDFGDTMSIALWVKPTAATQGVLLAHPSQYSLQRLADGSIQWTFQQADGGSISTTVPGAAPLNVWTHLVISYNDGVVKTFVNGRLVQTSSRPGALQTPSGVIPMTIAGQDQAGANLPFVGTLDELQLFERALDVEAAWIYLAGHNGFCVPAPTTLTVTIPSAIDYGTTSYHVDVQLKDGDAQALAGQSITLSSGFGGSMSTVTLVTDVNGVVSWNAPANIGPPGTYVNAFSAVFDGDVQYQRASVSRDITVQKLTPHVTWPAPADITYGTPLGGGQLNATADVPGTFTYSPPAGTVLGAGAQPLSVTFHPSDATTYSDATSAATLTVQKALPSMTISGGTFTYNGQPHSATASASDYLGQPLSPVSITYDGSSSAPSNAGTYSAVASYQGDSNYLPRSVSATITINKATPSVTWASPGAITYGTALSGAQLNASSDVPGSFSYTPSAGTTLAAGSGITLSATFTPGDAANYTATTANRTIDVLRTPLSVGAVNASKVFGAPLPAFSATGAGFVNGDSMASLSGSLVFSTTATASSPVGSYAVTPSGLSSTNYTITFAAGVLTVTQAGSVVAIGSSANPSGTNQAVTFNASVSTAAPGAGMPTGTIEFRDGSTRLGTVALTGGTASLTTNGLSATSHSISAIYSGDSNILGSSQSFTQNVLTSTQSSTTALSSSSNPAATGASVTLTATVTAPAGLSGNVAFYDGASMLGTVALSGTKAKLVISTLSNGTHAITARYLGNATIPPSISPVFAQTIKPSGTTLRNSNATVVASPSPSTLDQTVTFTATVNGNQSTPPTGVVVFFVDGFVVSGPVALSPSGSASARATFTTSGLAHGVHDVTVAYLGDGTYKGDAGTVSLTVN